MYDCMCATITYCLPDESADMKYPRIVDGVCVIVHPPQDKELRLEMMAALLDILWGREEGRRAGQPAQVGAGELRVPRRKGGARRVVPPRTEVGGVCEGTCSVEGTFLGPRLFRTNRQDHPTPALWVDGGTPIKDSQRLHLCQGYFSSPIY